MPVLHNRVSQKELKQLLMDETGPRTTISFYQYHPIQNPQEFRDALYKGLNVYGGYVCYEPVAKDLHMEYRPYKG